MAVVNLAEVAQHSGFAEALASLVIELEQMASRVPPGHQIVMKWSKDRPYYRQCAVLFEVRKCQ